jgi:hypothetical protein
MKKLWDKLVQETGRLAAFVAVHTWFIVAILFILFVDLTLDFLNHKFLRSRELSFFITLAFVLCFLVLIFDLALHVTKHIASGFGKQAYGFNKYVPTLVFVAAVMCTAFLVFQIGPTFRDDRLVVMGSSNVRSYLIELDTPHVNDRSALWLDLGSGAALRNIFQAFDYGERTKDGDKRFGLVQQSNWRSETKRAA